ncbi:YwqJ-related putative deaminase [Nocardiopsis dassonvillei]|uniref:YwqJ-related putative deaminase n=1 Tax=Nocardiopsis dassonvillei TaxID=2014 RepID=UPI0027E23077|nr:YwqJ-related putative deaminase [Nocardiopsis dassonvillei]
MDQKTSDEENGSPDALGSKPSPDDFLGLLNPKADFDRPLPSSMTDLLVMPVFGDDGRSGNPQGDPSRNPWGNDQAPTNPPADSTDRGGDGQPRGRGGSRGGRGDGLPFRDRGGRGAPPPASGPAQPPARSGSAPQPPVAGTGAHPAASAPPRPVWGGGTSRRLFGDTGTPQPTGAPQNPTGDTAQPPAPQSSAPPRRGDPDSAINLAGLDDTTAEDHRFPENLNDGRVIGRIPEARVTRDAEGKITTVDGKPLEDFQFDLVEARAKEVRDLLKDGARVKITSLRPGFRPGRDGRVPLEVQDLGGEMGAVNSIVVDRVTGLVAEGMNGRRGTSFIPPNREHPEIRRRIAAMKKPGGYDVYKGKKPTGEKHHFPIPDAPDRHAEIKAVNALLMARKNARISDFQIDNAFTLKEDEWTRTGCPCCANCSRITWGAPAPRAGKNTHPVGHPDYKVVYPDWTPADAQN